MKDTKKIVGKGSEQNEFLRRASALREITDRQLAELPDETRAKLVKVRDNLEHVSQAFEWVRTTMEFFSTSALSCDEQASLVDELQEYRRSTDSICQRLMKLHGVDCDPKAQRTGLVMRADPRLVLYLYSRVLELEDALSKTSR